MRKDDYVAMDKGVSGRVWGRRVAKRDSEAEEVRLRCMNDVQ